MCAAGCNRLLGEPLVCRAGSSLAAAATPVRLALARARSTAELTHDCTSSRAMPRGAAGERAALRSCSTRGSLPTFAAGIGGSFRPPLPMRRERSRFLPQRAQRHWLPWEAQPSEVSSAASREVCACRPSTASARTSTARGDHCDIRERSARQRSGRPSLIAAPTQSGVPIRVSVSRSRRARTADGRPQGLRAES